MSAGRLRKRVSFQRPDRNEDDAGGASIHWTTALVVWGWLIPDRGRERLEAGRLESASAALLRIRSSTAARAIDASWRAMIGTATYNVRAIVNPDSRGKYLELLVEQGVAQ